MLNSSSDSLMLVSSTGWRLKPTSHSSSKWKCDSIRCEQFERKPQVFGGITQNTLTAVYLAVAGKRTGKKSFTDINVDVIGMYKTASAVPVWAQLLQPCTIENKLLPLLLKNCIFCFTITQATSGFAWSWAYISLFWLNQQLPNRWLIFNLFLVLSSLYNFVVLP